MDDIRQKTLPESAFIALQLRRFSDPHRCQITRILIGREIDKHLLPRLYGELYRWDHIAVSRDDNSRIAILLIRIGHDLCCNPYVRLLLLVGMDDIPTFEAGDLLLQVLP